MLMVSVFPKRRGLVIREMCIRDSASGARRVSGGRHHGRDDADHEAQFPDQGPGEAGGDAGTGVQGGAVWTAGTGSGGYSARCISRIGEMCIRDRLYQKRKECKVANFK